MPKAERGTKRQCLKCGTKYYDLNKDPIVCPNCGAPFVAAEVAEKPRAKPAPAKPAKKQPVDETVEVDSDTAAAEVGAEVVSLNSEELADKNSDNDDDDNDEEAIPGLDDDEEEVEDIGGEVDNSFIEDDEEDDDNIEYGVKRDKDDD